MQLQTRVINILTKPKNEWRVIATEPADVARVFKEYVVILAAIPAIASFVGMTLIGFSVPFLGTVRSGFVAGLSSACVSYVFTLVGVYVSSLIIDKLAPTFNSTPNQVQALKLVAYASTPTWIAGVVNLVPNLSPLLIIAALYAIYLFYLGLPPLMNAPADKVIPYMLVAAVAIIVVSLLVGVLSTAVTRPFVGPAFGL